MKSVQLVKIVLAVCVFAAVSLVWSCKRDIPLPPAEKGSVRTVTFKLSGFESEIRPLAKAQAAMGRAHFGQGMAALLNITPSLEEQYLYYWSFNDENLTPDIAVDEVGAGIAFVGADETPSFGSGFALAPYAAGQALSIRGAQSLEVKLPMVGVTSLTTLAFDISSSNTGPKDFALHYSIDDGTTYEVLRSGHQFENMGAQSRNTYTVDVSEFSQFLEVGSLRLKWEFLAGTRGGDYVYNPNTGVVKLDNIRLSGVYNGSPATDSGGPDLLRYYIFSSADGSVVAQREMAMSELGAGGTLPVELEDGNYDVLFLAYRTAEGILLPETLTNASGFYFGQHFDARQAITYAAMLADVEVDEDDVEAAAILVRCYSLVEFSFQDVWSELSAVKKIEVSRLHGNHLYTPFGPPSSPPVSEAQTIAFDGLAEAQDYHLVFHQFLGLAGAALPLSYRLVAYDAADNVLNTVTVGESVPNNVILRFNGRLMGAALPDKFAIQIKTDWDDTIERPF